MFVEIDPSYRSVNPLATEDEVRVGAALEGAPYFFETEEYLMVRAKVTMQKNIDAVDGRNI